MTELSYQHNNEPDAYWVVIVDRRNGACRSLPITGEDAADRAHAVAQAHANAATFATVVGRR